MMRYLKRYDDMINEGRVKRSERLDVFRNDDIIVVMPLTHTALRKYANKCQWCINDDIHEWEDYHKGKHVIIIQRKPKGTKKGVTGKSTAEEIYVLNRWDSGNWDLESVEQTLEYQFRNETSMERYLLGLTSDASNFATDIVYYSPESGSVYDMEDNNLADCNKDIYDVPNMSMAIVDIINDFIEEHGKEHVNESNSHDSDITSLFDEFKGEVEVKRLRSHWDKNLDNNVNAISIRPTNPFTRHETTMDVNHLSWTLHSENDLLERIIDTCRTLEDEGNWISINVMRCKSNLLSILSDPFNEFWFQENISGRRGEDVYSVLEYAQKNYPDGFLEITIKWCKK
jgi:hypothetical protein